MGTIETAKESERGIVDIETLKYTNESLISTLDEVVKIQTEGRQKRVAAEAELGRIENELKQKLLNIKQLNFILVEKTMKLLRKKAFAISAMAIMIIAGIMYGSYFSISRAHHGAEQAFYQGEYYSIQDDLNRRMEYAQDMVYIAKQYNKQQADTHQQADVEPTQAAIDRLRHAKTLSEKYDADLDLENAMTDLYISLQGTNLKGF